MAWAERMPSGKYRGLYRDAHGRTRTVTGGPWSHKPKAVNAAAAKEQAARTSIWADPDAGKRPWGQWCTEWWPTRDVEPGTLKEQASNRDRRLYPRWGDVPLGSIRRHEVKAWVAQLLATKELSPSTVQRIVHLLSASLTAAVDAELIDANPAARIQVPRGPQAQERFLTAAEFAAVAEQLPTVHDRLIVQTLAYTGLRWGELAGLHTDRVFLDRGMIRVVETFDEKTGTIKAYPKGRRIRDVPVPAWLCTELKELETKVGCGVPHVTGRCRSGLLFTTVRGCVVRENRWAGRWRAAVAASGIGHARPHDLRHTYASWLLQAGMSLAEVGKLMGHMSPATTQKYAWLAETDTSAVLNALPAAPILPQLAHLNVSTDVHTGR